MIQVGDRIDVEILSTGFEGKGIAKLDDFVIFVDGGVEGDFVTIEIKKKKKNFADAKILELKIPSKKRISAKCKFFGTCGGCKYQHINYEEQLKFKREHVLDAIKHIGNLDDVIVHIPIPADEIFFYRNKMEYSFGSERWLTAEEIGTEVSRNGFFLGFHAPQKYNRIVNVDECFLQSELSNKILNFTRNFSIQNNLTIYDSETESGYLRNLVIRQSKNTSDLMVNLVTFQDSPELMKNYTEKIISEIPEITTVVNNINSRRAQIAIGETEKIYFGNGKINEKIFDTKFQISANSFFQTNTLQAEKLFEVVKKYSALNIDDVVYDLYCGTGSIALTIAENVKEVIGIELNENAIANAKINQEINGINNCEFLLGDLKDLLTKDVAWKNKFGHPTCIILDPPRNGLHPKVVDEVALFKTPKIIYVSCNPTTLARDLKLFSAHGYKTIQVQPVDMFPHTYHIEAVAELVLEK